MLTALRPRSGALALVLCLAACGGGSSGSTPVSFAPNTPVTVGSVSISPSTIAFAGTGSAPQTFTVSSTVAGGTGAVIDSAACAPAVLISGGSSTLPATYTVTPQTIGSCAIVFTVGTKSAAIGITVGTPPNSPGSIGGSGNGLTFTLGGAAQSYTVNVSGGSGPGTVTFDATACNGIATVSGAGGTPPQTFTATPVGVGSCAVTVTDGSLSFTVPITVNAPTSGTGLFVTPQALSFSSRNAPAQSIAISFQGNVGSVSIDESSCTNAKIAYFTLSGVAPGQPISLPANGTVTPYGSGVGASGSCTIVFTPQSGGSASLAINVSP